MRILLCGAILAVASPIASQAGDFKVKPGKSTSTTNMQMPMMPKGMQRTVENCLTEREANLSPAQLAKDIAGSESCSTTSIQQSSNSMSFEFQCKEGEMGTVNGSYSMSGGGDNFTFTGKMSGSVQGQPIEMTIEGTSKRIGDC